MLGKGSRNYCLYILDIVHDVLVSIQYHPVLYLLCIYIHVHVALTLMVLVSWMLVDLV